MLSLAWKDWERKASNFPPEVAFQWQLINAKRARVLGQHPTGNCIAWQKMHQTWRTSYSKKNSELLIKLLDQERFCAPINECFAKWGFFREWHFLSLYNLSNTPKDKQIEFTEIGHWFHFVSPRFRRHPKQVSFYEQKFFFHLLWGIDLYIRGFIKCL